MGYSHLLALGANLANFREAYGVPGDVDIAYCHEGDIALERGSGPNVVFFPLMAILEGRVRFPVNHLIVGTLKAFSLGVAHQTPKILSHEVCQMPKHLAHMNSSILKIERYGQKCYL